MITINSFHRYDLPQGQRGSTVPRFIGTDRVATRRAEARVPLSRPTRISKISKPRAGPGLGRRSAPDRPPPARRPPAPRFAQSKAAAPPPPPPVRKNRRGKTAARGLLPPQSTARRRGFAASACSCGRGARPCVQLRAREKPPRPGGGAPLRRIPARRPGPRRAGRLRGRSPGTGSPGERRPPRQRHRCPGDSGPSPPPPPRAPLSWPTPVRTVGAHSAGRERAAAPGPPRPAIRRRSPSPGLRLPPAAGRLRLGPQSARDPVNNLSSMPLGANPGGGLGAGGGVSPVGPRPSLRRRLHAELAQGPRAKGRHSAAASGATRSCTRRRSRSCTRRRSRSW